MRNTAMSKKQSKPNTSKPTNPSAKNASTRLPPYPTPVEIIRTLASATDIPSTPAELFTKFQTGFYGDPGEAVFKALGAD